MMNERLWRILKPISLVAVALVAAVSFLAASGECPLKAAKAEGAACAHGTCPTSGKTAKAEGATCEKGACPMGAKTAKAESCKGGACPMSGKMAAKAECQGGACPGKDLVNTALESGDFSTFLLAARAAGMMGELTCPKPKTLLAPTNEAFQRLPAEQWAALLQDNEALSALISRHIISGAIPAAELSKEQTAKASNGDELCVKHCNVSGKTTVDKANIVKADIVASNGYIQAIDSVLLPEAPAKTAATEIVAASEAVKVASTD